MTKNEKRAKKAAKTIRSAYQNHPARVVQEDVTDVLADLRHLCTQRDWDFADLDRTAYQHYIEELSEEER